MSVQRGVTSEGWHAVLRTSQQARQPFELWGQRGWPGRDVAGESHYFDAIRRVMGEVGEEWKEVRVTAQLLPEPTNRFDGNAVQVLVGGSVVGYLPKEDAGRYAPVLTTLVEQGWVPQVGASVHGAITYDFDRSDGLAMEKTFVGSVRLDLAEPHLLVPANLPPDVRHVMLPLGNAIQVTGEEAYLSTLSPLVGAANESWIYVTLHEVTEQLARSSRTVVEVRVSGSPAGTLTPKMSGELLPGLRHFAERGLVTAGRAMVKGNQIKADVVLYVARAGQLSAEWLASPPIGEAYQHGTPAGSVVEASADIAIATATVWQFNPPPGWPPAPAGWVPPAGWVAPPELPRAPDGWQWWVRA